MKIKLLAFVLLSYVSIAQSNTLGNMQTLAPNKVLVVGHTDSIGTDDYNQRLSLARAETIARYVRSHLKLKESQVEAVGYGESKPIKTNKTDIGRLKNRRVEFKVYYNKKDK